MPLLNDSDKERIRYSLGYLETSFAGSLQLGIPRPAQTNFLIEQAMDLLTNEQACDRVRSYLTQLDKIEQMMMCAPQTLVAEQLGDLKLRSARAGETYPDLLELEYQRWAKRIADILGVPLYPYSNKLQPVRRGVGNVSVRRH